MRINTTAAIFGFIIGTLLFITGFMVSNWITLIEHQKNIELQGVISEKITFMDIQNESYCINYDTRLSEKLDEAGSTLSILEQKFGRSNPIIKLQKENYSLLELKHFYSIKNYAKKCNEKITTILFFYSNQPDYIDDAEAKGYILSKLKDDNPDRIMIYSFDYDLDTEIIKDLKVIYDITCPNVVVINEEGIISEFDNINEIKARI